MLPVQLPRARVGVELVHRGVVWGRKERGRKGRETAGGQCLVLRPTCVERGGADRRAEGRAARQWMHTWRLVRQRPEPPNSSSSAGSSNILSNIPRAVCQPADQAFLPPRAHLPGPRWLRPRRLRGPRRRATGCPAPAPAECRTAPPAVQCSQCLYDRECAPYVRALYQPYWRSASLVTAK